MSSTILLTGGTGNLGGAVTPLLLRRAAGTVRILSRQQRDPQDGVELVRGDLESGEGVEAALRGVTTVVHCAGTAKGDEVKAQHLIRAAAAAGVSPHLVFISVVGAERVPVVSGVDRALFGYFAAKRAAERVIEASGLPWTTLRATQFHDLTFSTASAMAKLPIVPVPSGFRFQPVETEEVAARLVELALGEPAGVVPDLGGPTAYSLTDIVRSYLVAAGKRRSLVPVRMPGGAARAIRAGANLTLERAVGRRTWEQFLAARLPT